MDKYRTYAFDEKHQGNIIKPQGLGQFLCYFAADGLEVDLLHLARPSQNASKLAQARKSDYKINMAFIIGKKLKMTQIWDSDKVIPVTVVEAEPNRVSLLRTKKNDGYEAVQLTVGRNKKEFRISANLSLGDTVDVSHFKKGEKVIVSGISKGKGFQGGVKRYGFAGGPKTHGQKNRLRAPGSIGSTAPQRVLPGRRMAGHMGTEKVTVKNLEVASAEKENNLLMIKGAIPGPKGSVVEVRSVK